MNIKSKQKFIILGLTLIFVFIIFWYTNKVNEYKHTLNIDNLNYEIIKNKNTKNNSISPSEVSFKIDISDFKYDNIAIYFASIKGFNFRTYLNNEKIYTEKSNTTNSQNDYIIKINDNHEKKLLTVSYMSYSTLDSDKEILIGNYNDLVSIFFLNQLPYIFLGGSFLLIFLYMITGIVFINKKYFILWTSISSLMLSFGMLIITTNSGFNLLFPILKNYRIFLGTYAMLILMTALAYFSEYIFNEYFYKISQVSKIIIITFNLVFILLDIISSSDLVIFRSIINLVFFVQCLIIFILAIKCSFKGKKEAQLLILASIFFVSPIIISYIDALKNHLSSEENYWQIGLLLFSNVLFIIFEKIISKMHNDVIKYSNRLESLSEKLYHLDKLKDSFLKNTTHEFRTPLQGIIGISETILNESDNINDKNIDNIKTIIFISKNLNKLIEEIIDITKIKNKNLFLNTTPVDLWQVSEMIAELTNLSLKNKNIHVKNCINEKIPNVIADETRLRQILSNVIKTSVNYIDEGEIIISAQEEDCWIIITISDNGNGIEQNELKNIFGSCEKHRFLNSKKNYTNKPCLNLAKYLIEMHKGKIKIESKLGQGAKYIFTLPKLKKESLEHKLNHVESNIISNPINEPDSKKASAYNSKNHPNILIADTEMNIRVISNMLGVNYNIIKAYNGLEVLNLLKQNFKADLLIINVMLPKMSGFEVCKKVREQKSLYELPILLTTSKNHPDDILVGFESGANDYLSRPFYKHELSVRINTLLKLKTSVNFAINAELHFLQSQIKPHFLHNTLNTIVSLIKTNPTQARNLLIELSNYLRESFNFRYSKKFFPLEKEINIIKSYLYIEKARYPEKLKINYDIDKNINLHIPHLIFQPIIENAVRHGILKKRLGGEIKISIKKQNNCVLFNVFDNGIGIENNRIPLLLKGEHKDCGVGIVNINKRLKKIYGSELNIKSDFGKWTNVSIKIPF